MAAPKSAAGRCLIHAPRSSEDMLTPEQVARYLRLLAAQDYEVLMSPSFEERAQQAFDSASSGGGTLEGPALAKAVEDSLMGLHQLQAGLRAELAEPSSVAHLMSAFSSGRSGGISREDFAAFARFSVAYRNHCYFDTSQLEQSQAGLPPALPPAEAKVVVVEPAAVMARQAPPAPPGAAGFFGPSVVFVLGRPGAGKSTQCQRIAETFGYRHLCIDDLLQRESEKADSQVRTRIEQCIKENQPVPTEIATSLLQQELAAAGGDGGSSNHLIEGFPATVEELEGWRAQVQQTVQVKLALHFEIPEAAAEERLLEPHGMTNGHTDDKLQQARKRLARYRDQSVPLIDKLTEEGTLRSIDALRPVEEVWKTIRGLLGPSVIFVLGGPGVGKGTQCARMSDTFGYQHLSAGDLLREERRREGSKYGELIEQHIKEGKLVPAAITVQLLRQAMELRGWEGGKYLVDGFPRSFDNLMAWNEIIQEQVVLNFVVFFKCSEAVMQRRLLERGKTSGRADDNLESIRKRFLTFYHESLPVVSHFAAEGLLRNVNAEQDVETVWGDVQRLFSPSIVFVLGGPGAGKGTQCALISNHFGYKHLSAGDLLREERKRPGSEVGALIESYIKEGRIVPVEITVGLLEQAMRRLGWEGGHYLVDGFPRNMENLHGWMKVIGSKAQVKFTLYFDVPEDVMEARLLERGKTSGRADDNAETIRKRFQTFKAETMPVVEHFKAQDALQLVDAVSPVPQVWTNVARLFGPMVVFVLGIPGAGKKTQCSRIAQMFGFNLICTRVLLAEECERKGSQHADLIRRHMQECKPVPSDVVVQVLQHAMESRGWEQGRYLIEGFPKSQENLDAWDKAFGAKVWLNLVLCYDCAEVVMLKRRMTRQRSGLSGTPLDDQESVARSMQHFKDDTVPLLAKFESAGILRKIESEQSVEEVWSCTREVLRSDFEHHYMNQAVVLIKPHAHNEQVDRFVQAQLTHWRVAVLQKGMVLTQEVADRKLFDRQYFKILHNATEAPRNLEVAAEGVQRFEQAYDITWADALNRDMVYNAERGLSLLGKSPKELSDEYHRLQSVKLGPALYVARFDNGCFVVNAFAPHWREQFMAGTNGLEWLLVEFDPRQLSWERFRLEVLGATNPANAHSDSIRAQLYQHWLALGLKEQPDTMNNGVHASAGPLEALRERMVWTGMAPTDDPFGRMLLASGVPEETLKAWLDNPVVQDWPQGRERRSGPIFDCTEGVDSPELRDAALRFCRERLGGVSCWRVHAATGKSAATEPPAKVGGISGAKPRGLTLLHFNDVYNVEARPKEPVGGIARFVTRIRELKAESMERGEPEAMCLFSGDAFNPSLTSTVTKGSHMVPALNAVGVHTACYGNHDFDFGVDQLVKLAEETNFPWLISNVSVKATGLPLANGIITRMVDVQGRLVGLLGLVEQEWLVTLATIEPDDVDYEDFCMCGKRLAKELRQQGAELVIALTHMRVPNDELLAHEVEEIDLILGGHDHHYDVKPVGPHGTYVLKSGTDFRDITELRLEFADGNRGSNQRTFTVVGFRHIEINESIQEDSDMKGFVDECMAKLGAEMDKVIGETAVDLDCRFTSIRTRETNIGNFVTDIMRVGLKADVGFLNSGTLRADAIIEKGPIRARDMVNLLPMLDELCLLEVTGEQLLAMLQNAVSQYPRLEGRFAQVSGVRFTFDADKPGLERVLRESVQVGQEPLDTARRYKLVTKDYLRQGKDGYDVLRDVVCLADGEQAGILPIMVRDHLEDIRMLNGYSDSTSAQGAKRAALLESGLTPVGDGPRPLQVFAINPEVEGRIVCLNPRES